MKCPVHEEEETRVEFASLTGFCLKCLKHYKFCTSMKNLATKGCDRIKGHTGNHKNEKGDEWP